MGLPDIDIDFADRQQALELFTHVTAKIKNRKQNTEGDIQSGYIIFRRERKMRNLAFPRF